MKKLAGHRGRTESEHTELKDVGSKMRWHNICLLRTSGKKSKVNDTMFEEALAEDF